MGGELNSQPFRAIAKLDNSDCKSKSYALSFDTNHRLQTRYLARKTRGVRDVYDRTDILVGTGGFLGHTPQAGAADQNTPIGQVMEHRASVPPAFGGMPTHGTPCPMTGGAEGLILAPLRPGEDVGGGTHGAADKHWLSRRAEGLGNVGVTGPEGAGGALAVNEQAPAAAVDLMLLDLAGVVGDVVKELDPNPRK